MLTVESHLNSWTLCISFGHLQFMYSITSAMNNLIYLSSQNSLPILNHYKICASIYSDLCDFMP